MTVYVIGRLFDSEPAASSTSESLGTTYRRIGPAALDCYGEYAAVVWDGRNGNLLLARDPLGAVPLFYARTLRGGWRVATSAREACDGELRVNGEFLADMLAFPGGFSEIPSEATAWERVSRVRPGTTVTLSLRNEPRRERWWDWETRIDPDAARTSFEESADELKSRLTEAVAIRCRGHRAAVTLSGGMDSSTIAILADKSADSLVTTSLVYQGNALEVETPYLRTVAEVLPRAQGILIDGQTTLDFDWFRRALPRHGEPHAGLFRIAAERTLLESAARAGATVLLTGAGADEFLEGPPREVAELLRRGDVRAAFRRAQGYARATLRNPWSVFRELAVKPLLPSRRDADVPPWIRKDFASRHDLKARGRRVGHVPKGASLRWAADLESLNRAAGDWGAWHLGQDCGLSVSRPFLDTRVLSWALSVPQQYKRTPGVRKPLLAAAMGSALPEVIRTRMVKISFNDAYSAGLSANLSRLSAWLDEESPLDEIFDRRMLKDCVREHAGGIGDAVIGARLNLSLAMIAWSKQFPGR
ncbi:MAG: hypothetical protein IT428_11215 [Planctomycetaceae bacterium]|nr:hypothetical protein [Planctomycetaceae bacterium]